jgi:hypothetical protein
VITKDAKTDAGVFNVHRIKEKVYYEIPKSELGKDFLWVSQIARTTLGVGYGGQAAGRLVVRWERYNNRVLLRSVSYEVVADPKLPVARAVQAANNNPIIMSFWIEALGKDDAPVIDVTRLFTTEVTEFSAEFRAVDATRHSSNGSSHTRLTSRSKPRTHSSPPDTTTSVDRQPAANRCDRNAHRQRQRRNVLAAWSSSGEADDAALFDERGYFTVRQTDYGQDEHRARAPLHHPLAARKRDPNAAVSEPVKPIVIMSIRRLDQRVPPSNVG